MRTFAMVMTTVSGALLLAGCGDVSADGAAAGAADKARELINPSSLAENLPPEARAIVTSYERDLRGAAAAHLAEFGQLPASFAEVPTVAATREAAVNLIADGIGEQIPFASRATAEQAANSFVTAAERRILDQMRTENAANQ
jgi:hypothetical protein